MQAYVDVKENTLRLPQGKTPLHKLSITGQCTNVCCHKMTQKNTSEGERGGGGGGVGGGRAQSKPGRSGPSGGGQGDNTSGDDNSNHFNDSDETTEP